MSPESLRDFFSRPEWTFVCDLLGEEIDADGQVMLDVSVVSDPARLAAAQGRLAAYLNVTSKGFQELLIEDAKAAEAARKEDDA